MTVTAPPAPAARLAIGVTGHRTSNLAYGEQAARPNSGGHSLGFDSQIHIKRAHKR